MSKNGNAKYAANILSFSNHTHTHTRTLNTYVYQMCTSVPCMSHRSTSGDACFGCYSYAAINGTRSTEYVQISLWFCLCTLFEEHRNKRSRSYTQFNVRPHIHTHQYTHKRIYRKMQLSTFQACFLLLYWLFFAYICICPNVRGLHFEFTQFQQQQQ